MKKQELNRLLEEQRKQNNHLLQLLELEQRIAFRVTKELGETKYRLFLAETKLSLVELNQDLSKMQSGFDVFSDVMRGCKVDG